MAVKNKTSPHSAVPLPVQYIIKRTEIKTVLCCILVRVLHAEIIWELIRYILRLFLNLLSTLVILQCNQFTLDAIDVVLSLYI